VEKLLCGQVVCGQVVEEEEEEAGGGGGGPEEAGVQNQKQEPHTKMWGKNTLCRMHI